MSPSTRENVGEQMNSTAEIPTGAEAEPTDVPPGTEDGPDVPPAWSPAAMASGDIGTNAQLPTGEAESPIDEETPVINTQIYTPTVIYSDGDLISPTGEAPMETDDGEAGDAAEEQREVTPVMNDEPQTNRNSSRNQATPQPPNVVVTPTIDTSAQVRLEEAMARMAESQAAAMMKMAESQAATMAQFMHQQMAMSKAISDMATIQLQRASRTPSMQDAREAASSSDISSINRVPHPVQSEQDEEEYEYEEEEEEFYNEDAYWEDEGEEEEGVEFDRYEDEYYDDEHTDEYHSVSERRASDAEASYDD